MSTNVPQAPSAFPFAGVRVAQPVVSGGLSRLSDDLAFVLGHNLHVCGTASIRDRAAGRTPLKGLGHSVWIPYARSPGARVARLVVELHPGTESDGTQTLTATLPTGATWLDAGGLDGSVVFRNPSPGLTAPSSIVGWIDVSAVDPTALTLACGVSSSPNSKGYGIRRASLVEVPLASLAVDAAEAGWDAAATRPGRLVIDGGASSPRGTQRLFHLLDLGRAAMRQHFAVVDVQSGDVSGASTTPHWCREAATRGAIDWQTNGTPHWYLSMRSLFGASVKWKARVLYRTSNAVDCALRFHHDSGNLTSGWSTTTAAHTDITLPATSGVWAWVTADLTIPHDDSAVRVWFEATGPGSGQLLSLATLGAVESHA